MSDLEQKIREAVVKTTAGEWATNGSVIVTFPEDEYVAEADRGEDCAYIALACPANILALLAEKDAERDEWKRIAGDLADQCELLRKYDPRPFSERLQNQKAIDACDVLAGRGE